MTYTITNNTQFNSIEISFDSIPAPAVRQALKDLRFRWHSVKKVWYGYTTEETARAAIDGKPAAKVEKAEKVNKFGVKVGDLFYTSWGYEQTNVNFFQVIELVGTSSVRVREVYPPMIDETAVSGMSADRTYKITRDLLPAASHASFIKDQEKGDLKRLKSYMQDGSHPQFNLSSFANAYLVEGDSIKTYESWYY